VFSEEPVPETGMTLNSGYMEVLDLLPLKKVPNKAALRTTFIFGLSCPSKHLQQPDEFSKNYNEQD